MSLSFFKLYHASQYRQQLHGAEIAAEAEPSLHAPPLPLLSTHPLAQQRLGRVLDDRRQSAVVVQQQNQLAVLQNRLFRPGLTLFTQTGGKRVCGAEQRKIEPLWSGVAPWRRRRKLAGIRVWCGGWGRVRVRSRPKLLHPLEPLRLFFTPRFAIATAASRFAQECNRHVALISDCVFVIAHVCHLCMYAHVRSCSPCAEMNSVGSASVAYTPPLGNLSETYIRGTFWCFLLG